MRAQLLTAAALLTFATSASAGSGTFFNPLTQSAVVSAPNSSVEEASPWLVPPGVSQELLTRMAKIEAEMDQSIVRAPGAGTSASMFDMLAFGPRGENIFIPHETPNTAGMSRYNIAGDISETLFAGDGGGANGDFSNDYAAFDPATFTPNGTVFAGEEWSGEGRIIEVMNPFAAPGRIRIRELESIANVAHEGLRFSEDGGTLYFVDEWNSGALYKIVFNNRRDYAAGGQTFVLSVDAFNGEAADNYNDPSNEGQPRTGAATWVAMTDANGTPLTSVDPFRNGPTNDPRSNADTRGGRPAADELGATPYGRPEDMEVGKLNNGHEVVYFAATSERTIYSVEELGGCNGTRAMVRVFANDADTPKNEGFLPTSAELNSPDNLAQDALGNIYIIEDAPNGSSTGGDIWFVRDVNSDGVAESVDHFLTLQVAGSEATGMIFNPVKPTEFVVAIQHPASTDLGQVPGGYGDAIWRFDLSEVVAPPCQWNWWRQFRSSKVKACNHMTSQFADKLEEAARPKPRRRRRRWFGWGR